MSCRNSEHHRDSAMSSIPDASSADDDGPDVMSSLEHESNDLWKQHRLVAFGTLTIPVWLSMGILIAAFLVQGSGLVRRLLLATLAAAAAGRFIIWGGDTGSTSIGFSAMQLALVVLYLDTIWAVVLTWHAGFLFHLPWLGQRLRAAVGEGSDLLKRNRWMRRMTVIAVLLFVMLPVSSTGSIGGSLLGRLLGLSQLATFSVVLLGSVIGGAIMLVGAELLEPWFSEVSPLARYGGVVALVVVAFVLSRRYSVSLGD
jgi:uncharacterized membrane protein